MSSQGPKATGTPKYNGFKADPASGTPSVAIGYPFTAGSIRDGSDWIAYKKQTLISKEHKTKLKSSHPDIAYSNDYRIQYLLGRYKNPTDTDCNGCPAEQNTLFNQRASDDSPPS